MFHLFCSKPSPRRVILVCLLMAAPVQAQEPVPITVKPLAAVAVYPERDAPATAVSLNDAVIAAEVAGRIDAIPVRVGDVVEAGALLAQQDCRDYALEHMRLEAGLKALEAQSRFAVYQLQRAQALARQKNVSQELLNQRQSEKAVLDARLQEQSAAVSAARRNVDKCRITAPFRALVYERRASIGERRNPGEPIVRLIDLGSVEVSAQVPAAQVAGLRTGGTLSFEADEASYPLTLRAALAAVDSRTGTRELRLDFTGKRALPGAAGRLVWRASQPHVPPDLLVRRGNDLGVFSAGGGRAVYHPLRGALEGRPAPAVLPGDTLIVIDGRHGLKDGEPVKITE